MAFTESEYLDKQYPALNSARRQLAITTPELVADSGRAYTVIIYQDTMTKCPRAVNVFRTFLKRE